MLCAALGGAAVFALGRYYDDRLVQALENFVRAQQEIDRLGFGDGVPEEEL